ncbi:MAG TPA: hypothetical protein VGJ30_11290 [Candidatus Angelobacter sp.]|jgi:hypothetical protein
MRERNLSCRHGLSSRRSYYTFHARLSNAERRSQDERGEENPADRAQNSLQKARNSVFDSTLVAEKAAVEMLLEVAEKAAVEMLLEGRIWVGRNAQSLDSFHRQTQDADGYSRKTFAAKAELSSGGLF